MDISPTPSQRPKLAALRRTHPALLVLKQCADGTIHVSVPARVHRGRVQPPRACLVRPTGRLDWR